MINFVLSDHRQSNDRKKFVSWIENSNPGFQQIFERQKKMGATTIDLTTLSIMTLRIQKLSTAMVKNNNIQFNYYQYSATQHNNKKCRMGITLC